MKVTIEKAEACRRILRIEVPVEKVDQEYRDVAKAIALHAHVPGFRAGRAPQEMVERRFAKQISEEVRDRLLGHSYHEAIRAEKLTPVAVVDINDAQVSKGNPLVYTVTVDVAPEFEVPAYKEFHLERKDVSVSEAEVDGRLDELRLSRGKIEEVKDRGVQKDDFIQIDFSGTIDGTPVSEIAGEEGSIVGGAQDFWELLRENDGVLPGLLPAIEGLRGGETRQIEIHFPADFKVKALADKKANYTVTVKQIRERQKAELNEAFLKQFGVSSEADLRSRIMESLKHTAETEEDRRLRGELIQWLISKTQIPDLPQTVVANETRRLLQDIVQENLRRGIPREEIENHREDIFSTATKTSGERVKLDYILARIAQQENVQVSDAEVNDEVERLAVRMKSAPSKIRRRLEQHDALENLRTDLKSQKTLDLLMDRALSKT